MSKPIIRTGHLGPLIVFAILFPLLVSVNAEQTGEWHAYASDKASTKYSPLDQVNADNVNDLQIVWRQSTIPDAVRQGNTMQAPGGSQNTPLMAGGLLYVSTSLGTVAALDAATGEVVWFDTMYQSENEEAERSFATRGLAYWTDGNGDARILAVIRSKLVALNATTGKRYPDFGDSGEVNLIQGYDDRTVKSFS